MTAEEIIANERYHTCGRCKWGDLREDFYPCNECNHSTDKRRDYWQYADSESEVNTDEIDEAIKHCEEVVEINEAEAQDLEYSELNWKYYANICLKKAKKYKQVAEWLRELNTYREFADWLVKAVLEEDWEESADFYAEVLCRKLTKLGKLKVVDNKYMEVNADECNL